MLSSTWPILSISFRFIRWDKITEWAKCCTSVLLQDSNGCFSRWSIYAACQIHTLIKYEASYQHAILRYFIFLFRLLMAKSGKNLTVRRWHHLLMPESKGKQPWLLISRTLVWWMRTSAAAPYSSTLMVLMQEIRYVFFSTLFFFLDVFLAHLHCSPVTFLVIKTTFKRRENDVFTRKRSCEIDV